MRTLSRLKRLQPRYVAPALLLVIALLYVFFTYSSWLTSRCIAPLGADVKFHVATVSSFVEQIKQHGWLYPVEYIQDVSGFYWYTRSLLPLMAPGLMAFILPLNTAFFLVFMLWYVMLTLGIYFLVKTVADEFAGFIAGVFFLFSNLSNMVFSVGGNYQFFFGLLFFVLSMAFLFRYTHHPTKKNLLLLCLCVIALGMSYIFSLIFFLSFWAAYALWMKNWRSLKIAVLVGVALSLFVLPSVVTGSSLHINPDAKFYSFNELVKLYILPTSPFSWIYQKETPYAGQLDFNQGIHIYLAGLVAVLLVIIKRHFTKASTFLFTYLAVMVGWVILALASRVLPFDFLQSFFTSSVPTERLMMHVAIAFLLPVGYVLHRLAFSWESFVPVFILGILTTGTTFLTNKLFFAFIGIILLFSLKHLLAPRKHTSGLRIAAAAVLLVLLLFPLTGKVEQTNLMPRTPYFIVDDAKNHLDKDDVFLFKGGWSLEQIIMSCTKTPSIVQIDRDAPLSGLSGDIDMLNPSEETKKTLEMRGVTKLLLVLDQILENGKINESKAAHLVQWYGQPTIMQPTVYDKGKEKDYYPTLVFNIPRQQRDYGLEMRSPRKLLVTNTNNKESLLLNLEYHPWWKARNKESGEKIPLVNDRGLMRLNGAEDAGIAELTFSMKYFVIGGLISFIGLMLLVVELRKKRVTSEHTSP